MEKIIKVQNVSFAYSREEGSEPVKAIDGISFEIEAGSFTAIIGKNGSGKSTLAKNLNGLLLPTEGDILVADYNTKDDAHIWDVRQTAGMVFQNPDNQIVATVVEEDVAFGLENLGVPPAEIRKRVDAALKDVGMYEFRKHAPHQLSGGQKQRIAIAGIIAMRPKLIILDEPTAMLDPRGRHEVLSTVKKLNREDGVTVLLITHYMEEAAECGRVVIVDKGHILLDSTPKDVFSHVALLREIGLDVPQSTQLVHELRRCGIDLPEDIITAEECADALAALLSQKGVGA